jgi:hypothetical protein
MAAALSRAASDRAPVEIALLVVCVAVLIAVAALVIRWGRARYRRLGRLLAAAAGQGAGTQDVTQSEDDTVVQQQAGRLTDTKNGGKSPDGTTGPDSTGSGSRGRPRTVVLVPAAAVIVVAAVAAAVVLVGSGHGTASRGNVIAAGGSVPGQPAGPAVPAATSPAPGKHPAKGAHASPGPGQSPKANGAAASGPGSGSAGSPGSGSANPAPSVPASAPADPAPSTSPAGTLSIAPTGLIPMGHVINEVYLGSFTVTAVDGPVSYSIAELPSDVPDITLTASPSSGTLQAGQQATIELVSNGTVTFTPYVTVDPGGIMVGVTFPS